MGGAAHDHWLRRVAASSAPFGTLVVPYNGNAWIVPEERASEVIRVDREVSVNVELGPEGFAVVDLRPLLIAGESLHRASSSAPLRARVGRDLIVLGDMEDVDVDDDFMEASVWYYTGLDRAISSYQCQKDAYRGAMALCSIRQVTSDTEATISIRNRVRVLGDKLNLPEKELTLLAYVSGDNAGPVRTEVMYSASFGPKTFGSQTLHLPPGSYPWKPLLLDLEMPADLPEYPRDPEDPNNPLLRTENARAFRVYFHQSAPPAGAGIFRVDDVAVITWQDALDLAAPSELSVPHARDFLRVEGEPGRYELQLELSRWLPAAAYAGMP